MPEDAAAVEAEVQRNIYEGRFTIRKLKDGQVRVKMSVESSIGTTYNEHGRKQKTASVEVAVSLNKGFHWFPVPEEEESQ